MKQKFCGNCGAWKEEIPRTGTCYRNPPVIIKDYGDNLVSRWPETYYSQNCLAWIAKEDKEVPR